MAETIVPLLTSEQLSTRVRELGQEITRFYHEGPVVLVCVLKGSFVFTADLMRCIDLPLRVDFLGTRSYGEGTESSGVASWRLAFFQIAGAVCSLMTSLIPK